MSDVIVNDSTSGANLIQEQVATMLVEPLEAASVVLSAGPTIFNSSEPLRINTLTDFPDAEWVGENELIPDDGAAAFGEIELMPTSRKSIKRIIRVSNELIRMAKTGVTATLQAKLVKTVQAALDDALLAGDGSDDSITGIINQPNITKTTLAADDPDSYLDAIALAASKEVKPTHFVVNGQDFFNLRKIKDQNGRYILQADVSGEAAYRLHGVPVIVTNKMPEGKALLADMKEIAVVRDVDPQITILTERYAEYDQVGIRVVTRYDLGLIRPEGVILMETGAAA